ncbi:MAG: hypothetical protein LAO05_04965 [Acidobacteriia bacterium]|nr:hypothetical protein [Terriglobia bacterium]
MDEATEEFAYYRAVEDHFAALRGTPFLFSPKDFALLRGWWKEGIPLAAVLTGVGEAWERRREREEDPISSLSYCRHAVRRHAKRLSAARVGAAAEGRGVDVPAALTVLAAQVNEIAERWRELPALEAVLRDLGRAVATLPPDLEPATADEILTELEFTTLDALMGALPSERTQEIAREVADDLATMKLEPDVEERTRRALSLKNVRRMVGLPRLELDAGAP